MSNHDFANDIHDEHMGLMTSYRWKHDPKTVLFQLARYKWVAKMLRGYGNVIEVGCADGFGSKLVAPCVGHLTAIDIDTQMVEDARRYPSATNLVFLPRTMKEVSTVDFDAAYCLDVLEHTEHEREHEFMEQFAGLAPVGIIGMPSLESQLYASKLSADNHVNCKTEAGLRMTMTAFYRHVFMFGMNDEVVHTGFGSMAHYRLALGIR